VNVLKLKPADIDIGDIAFALSYINRYNGWIGACSVGYHSILVSTLLPEELKLHGLLHDASEAYIQDIVCLTKGRLRICPERRWMSFKKYEDRVMRVIYAGLELELPSLAEHKAVSEADRMAACMEQRHSVEYYERSENRPGRVAVEFLRRFRLLYVNQTNSTVRDVRPGTFGQSSRLVTKGGSPGVDSGSVAVAGS
jgi:hypothetical protein